MSHKSARIAERIAGLQGGGMDPHYLGFFDCFNQGQYYEAHDVLEELWLARRGTPDDGFYKGLIQLAGAFVHLQKNRLKPAAALFRLSTRYLSAYPQVHHGLALSEALGLAALWTSRLEEGGYAVNPIGRFPAPRLMPAGTSG